MPPCAIKKHLPSYIVISFLNPSGALCANIVNSIEGNNAAHTSGSTSCPFKTRPTVQFHSRPELWFQACGPLTASCSINMALACSQICIVNHNLGQLPQDKLVWDSLFISREGPPPLQGPATPSPGSPTFGLSQENKPRLVHRQSAAPAWFVLCGYPLHNSR